jgi:hypothetical protein
VWLGGVLKLVAMSTSFWFWMPGFGVNSMPSAANSFVSCRGWAAKVLGATIGTSSGVPRTLSGPGRASNSMRT